MSDLNKDIIDVLNDLIETSKNGEKGFNESAEDIKTPAIKTFFTKRAEDCRQAAAELQSEVRRLGGDPETTTSVAADLHRGWVNLKSMVTGKDDEAILNEVERGEDVALKSYKDAREKLVKLNVTTGDPVYALVQKQLDGVQKNHDEVKALRNAARARS